MIEIHFFLYFKTPGLNELNTHDFTRILNTRIFDYWIVSSFLSFSYNRVYSNYN